MVVAPVPLLLVLVLAVPTLGSQVPGRFPPRIDDEARSYEITAPELPQGAVIEVGGLAFLRGGRPVVSTRRGEIWIGSRALGEAATPLRWTRFAEGLQEPLGLLVEEPWILCVQRGELSRLRDLDGDDVADVLETLCDAWPLSGNYHEYAFGPRRGPGGDLWITTNKPFGDEPFGRADWRGFALRIDGDGRMTPVACGLRSPAGLERSPSGEMFFTDNQGEWCGASKLAHLAPGDFHGHPWGVFSCHRAEWTFGHPGAVPDGRPMPQVAREIPSFRLPAVWFPYDAMGRSPSGFAWDATKGAFGPFPGQIFVGDQHHAAVFRVFLEQVNGHWQGACFPFRSGFGCGITRVAFAPDGSLVVGESNRGWPSRGRRPFGLERLRWTGEVPFEIHEVRARPEGFELTFTRPVDAAEAARRSSYSCESYTYLLHSDYGSPEIDRARPEILAVHPAADGRSVLLDVGGLRAGYVHELNLAGVRDRRGHRLLHPVAYYTLIERPGPPEPLPAGYRSLLDGDDLAAWQRPYDWGTVRLVDGEVRLRGHRKFFLVSRDEFHDFEFTGEVMVPVGGNSGFQFRSRFSRNRVWGYQAEVDPSERRWAGGIYDEGRRGWIAPVEGPERRGAFRAGAWNRYRIRAEGDRLRVWIGDVLVSDVRDPVALAGHLALQHHGEAGLEYRFRRLGVRPLGAHRWVRRAPAGVVRLAGPGHRHRLAEGAADATLRVKLRAEDARGGLLVRARRGPGGVVVAGLRATVDPALGEARIEDVGRGRVLGRRSLTGREREAAWHPVALSVHDGRAVMHVHDRLVADLVLDEAPAGPECGVECFASDAGWMEFKDLEALVPDAPADAPGSPSPGPGRLP